MHFHASPIVDRELQLSSFALRFKLCCAGLRSPQSATRLLQLDVRFGFHHRGDGGTQQRTDESGEGRRSQ